MLRIIKASSSKWVKETHSPLYGFKWQEGYSCFSVSESAAGKVSNYIDNQEKHHKKVSFKEEIIVFFKKHGIEYDPAIFEDE